MNVLENWEHKRKIYKKLPRAIRYPVVGLAFLLLPTGIIVMFTPLAVFEVGTISVFTSLTILSFEFSWAYKLLLWLKKKLADKRVRKKLAFFMLLLIVTYVAIAIVWLRNK